MGGTAVGLVVCLLTTRSRRGETPAEGDGADGGGFARVVETVGATVGDALDAGLQGFRAGRSRPDPSEVDVGALQRSLEDLPWGGSLRLRELGRGIVEVVGTAPDEASAREVLARLAGEPGVEVVVNRVWSSPAPEPGAPS